MSVFTLREAVSGNNPEIISNSKMLGWWNLRDLVRQSPTNPALTRIDSQAFVFQCEVVLRCQSGIRTAGQQPISRKWRIEWCSQVDDVCHKVACVRRRGWK